MPLVVPPSIATLWGTHDCRLEWNSATTIRLVREGGKHLMISGVRREIPVGGIVRATPSTDANFLVFAYMETPTTMNLWFEASATGFANDSNGMAVINGHPEWTLVGAIWAQSTGIDGPRLVCSYYNRRPRSTAANPGLVQSGATSPAVLTEAATCYWVAFGGDGYEAACTGHVYTINTPTAILATHLYTDGGGFGPSNNNCPAIANAGCLVGIRVARALPAGPAGLHSSKVMAWQNVGIANWVVSNMVRWMA